MAKLRTILAPTTEGPVEVYGYVANLDLPDGKGKWKCLMQLERYPHAGVPKPKLFCLTDYASGMKIINETQLNAARLRHINQSLTDRQLCQMAFDRLLRSVGVEKFLSVVTEAETLNKG